MEARSADTPRRSCSRPPKKHRPDVTPDQLRVEAGSLPLGPALDALAELLVDAWLARKEAQTEPATGQPVSADPRCSSARPEVRGCAG